MHLRHEEWLRELAWAAGVFEGEGTITASNRRVVVSVTNTDRWVVSELRRVVHLGWIYGPYTKGWKDGYNRKPVWVWKAMNDEADEVLELFEPWLSPQRLRQAEQVYTGFVP